MTSKSTKCEKGKDPKGCTPEQIRKCHGPTAAHPCTGAAKSTKK